MHRKWNGGYSITFEKIQKKRKSPKKNTHTIPYLNESVVWLCVCMFWCGLADVSVCTRQWESGVWFIIVGSKGN